MIFIKFICFFMLILKQSDAFSIAKCTRNDAKPIILETTVGKLAGSCEFVTVNDNNLKEVKSGNVYSWKSVPYAEPPIGSLRFKKTVEKASWLDQLDATQSPNSCMQQNVITHDANNDLNEKFAGFKMWSPLANFTKFSEDCLYLNIWAPLEAYLKVSSPQPTLASKSIPILVFFHDGKTVSGTSSLDAYDPSTFVAATNTIVITVNYRLGIFGFLYLEDHFPGNQAVYDQYEALKWIKKNAERLGGDPNRITLIGSGTGASLAGLHLFNKDSWDLYNNVILQSGTPLLSSLQPISKEEANKRAKKVLSYINCFNDSSNDKAYESAALCAQKSEFISRAGRDFLLHSNNNSKISELFTFTVFPPVIDNQILTDSPINLLKSGNFNRCPLLTGFTVDEGSMSIAESGIVSDIKKQPSINHAGLTDFLQDYFQFYPSYPYKSNKLILNSILHEYSKLLEVKEDSGIDEFEQLSDTLKKNNYFQTLNKIIGEQMFICPAYRLADLVAKTNTKVFLYLYAHRLSSTPWPSWYGAVHRDELAFTFGHPLASNRDPNSLISVNPWGNPKHRYTNLEKILATEITQYWANFARHNNPNSKLKSTKHWPEYTLQYSSPDGQDNSNAPNVTSTGRYIIFKTNGTKSQRGFSLESCQFWNSYLPNLLEQAENLANEKLTKLKQHDLQKEKPPADTSNCQNLSQSVKSEVSINNDDANNMITSSAHQQENNSANTIRRGENLKLIILILLCLQITFIFLPL